VDKNLVAIYILRDDAGRVRDRLIALGIPATDIRLSPASDRVSAAEVTATAPHERRHSFWDWLFGEDVPEHDRAWYHANLREGRTALSVLVRSDAEREQVADILEEFNPVHMDDGTETGAAPVSMGAEQGEYARSGSSEMRTGAPGLPTEGEQVIPVVKEELAVGKRASERRYRVRTYVVETPVEEQVRLRDERVIVERRPAHPVRSRAVQGPCRNAYSRSRNDTRSPWSKSAPAKLRKWSCAEKQTSAWRPFGTPCARPRLMSTRSRQTGGRMAAAPSRQTAIHKSRRQGAV
jgi:hypothetical protein